MTEKEPPQIVTLRSPAQCILWEHPERIENAFSEILEEIETYEDSSHLTRSLHKCQECGQLYFFEWNEWVDWEEGNDRQYSTLIPVQTKEEAETLKGTSVFNFMTTFRACTSTENRRGLERTKSSYNARIAGGVSPGGACRASSVSMRAWRKPYKYSEPIRPALLV